VGKQSLLINNSFYTSVARSNSLKQSYNKTAFYHVLNFLPIMS